MADPLLPDALVADAVAELPGFDFVDGSLHAELAFVDFAAAFSFMTAVALTAERLDHHPDWSNSWNRVVIDIRNHDAGGVTERCVQLARAVVRAAAAAS